MEWQVFFYCMKRETVLSNDCWDALFLVIFSLYKALETQQAPNLLHSKTKPFFFLFNTFPVEQSVSCPRVHCMPTALTMQSAGIRIGSGGGNRNCSLLASLRKTLPSAREIHPQGNSVCVLGMEGGCACHAHTLMLFALKWKKHVVGLSH